jgi:hypothetical protein
MSGEATPYIEKLRNVAEDANFAWWKDATDVRDESDVLLEVVAAQVLRDLIAYTGRRSVYPHDIHEFAEERGIALGGER